MQEVLKAFPEAMIEGYEHLEDQCANQQKDRHVLACALHGKAELILTFNLKDFSSDALDPWGIEVKHPDHYLLTLYSIEPTSVVHRLQEIAREKDEDFESYLLKLGKWLPSFSRKVYQDIFTAP